MNFAAHYKASADVQPPRGRIVSMPRENGRALSYFLYIPYSAAPDAEIFVSVHGLARNAVSHVMRFRSYAEQAGVICLAPLFSRRYHHRFQRLAPGRGGVRPDDALSQAIDEVGQALNRPIPAVKMFGYSGGGQFVHRYALRNPGRVSAAILAAPGWYTFPDETAPYPYGLAASGGETTIDIEPFLNIPVTVIVGDRDNTRDDALNKSEAIDRAQGRNRLERAQNWVAAIGAACAARGLSPSAKLIVLPRANHSFEQNMDRRDLGGIVTRQLFAATSNLANRR